MRQVEKYRADGKTELADAVQTTIVTTAEQREAVLVPMQTESGGRMNADQLRRYLFGSTAANFRSRGNEVSADIFEFLDTDEEREEFQQRRESFYKLLLPRGVTLCC